MIRRTETPEPTPLLDEIASAIIKTGSFQRELKGNELDETKILSELIENLISKQQGVAATLTTKPVWIYRQIITVEGNIQVETPVNATISFTCKLGNGRINSLKLAALEMNVIDGGSTAKIALYAFKKRAQKALHDPNKVLFTTLSSKLAQKGVVLTGIGLHNNDSTLAVALSGQPITRK